MFCLEFAIFTFKLDKTDYMRCLFIKNHLYIISIIDREVLFILFFNKARIIVK